MNEMAAVPIKVWIVIQWVAPLILCSVVTDLVHIPNMDCGPMPRSRGLETQRSRNPCRGSLGPMWGRDCSADGRSVLWYAYVQPRVEDPVLKTALTHTGAVLIVTALATVAGCQRDENVPETAALPAAGNSGPASAAAAPGDTDSSLAIKRGTIALTADTRVLRFCGQSEDIWLAQQDDQTLDETYAKLAGEPGTPLFVEIRGNRVASPPGTSIPASFKHAFVLEELLYAGVPAEGIGCPATAPAYHALARGNEPFWSVEIGSDQLLLRQASSPTPSKYALQETQDAEGSVTYRGTSGDKALEITIMGSPCGDSMSGEYFAYTAELTLDGRSLRGCARIGE